MSSRSAWLTQLGRVAAIAALGTVAGCGSGLLAPPKPPPALYTLEATPTDAGTAPVPAARAGAASITAANITLVVELPRAAAGHDTALMAYQRQAPQLEYFASHQWVAPPAQMLAPLVVRELQDAGAFRAVTQAPTAALSQWRLEISGLRVLQDFDGTPPSRLRIGLRAVLVETATRRVLATRDFTTQAPAAAESPAGGAVAARVATRELLQQLREFCVQAARG